MLVVSDGIIKWIKRVIVKQVESFLSSNFIKVDWNVYKTETSRCRRRAEFRELEDSFWEAIGSVESFQKDSVLVCHVMSHFDIFSHFL